MFSETKDNKQPATCVVMTDYSSKLYIMIRFCWNKFTRVGPLQLDLVWTSSSSFLTRGRRIFSVLDSLS